MAVRYNLKNFTPDILTDYVRFRTFHAGSNKQIFSTGALDGIYEFTRGNPRLVNVVCDNALFEGFVRRAELPLGRDVVESVASDLGLPPIDPSDEPTERR